MTWDGVSSSNWWWRGHGFGRHACSCMIRKWRTLPAFVFKMVVWSGTPTCRTPIMAQDVWVEATLPLSILPTGFVMKLTLDRVLGIKLSNLGKCNLCLRWSLQSIPVHTLIYGGIQKVSTSLFILWGQHCPSRELKLVKTLALTDSANYSWRLHGSNACSFTQVV